MLNKLPLIKGNGRIKTVWDIFLAACVFGAALYIPYGIFSGARHADKFYWLITLVFSIDIILAFNTTVKVRRAILFDRKSVGRLYLKTWFLPDLLSALPFVPAVLLFAGSGTEAVPFKIMLALNLFPLIKLFKAKNIFREIQENLSINPSIMRLLSFAFWFALAAHFMALGWIAIGAGDTSGDPLTRYIRALYWTITTIATIGYGDITPDRNSKLQMLYTIIVQLLGVGMYGYIIGNITSLVANIDVAKANFIRKMEVIKDYMRVKKIPPEIKDKVSNYYHYIWETKKSIDNVSFLTELPHTLGMEISLFLNRGIIEKVSFFKDADEIFIREVVQLLEPIVFLPDDYIIRQGEYGECMYFVSAGAVEVLVNDKKVAELGAGSFFGETSLVCGEKRNASVRAKDYCDVYRLSKQRFDNLRTKYPEFDKHVSDISAARSKQ